MNAKTKQKATPSIKQFIIQQDLSIPDVPMLPGQDGQNVWQWCYLIASPQTFAVDGGGGIQTNVWFLLSHR